MKQGIEHLLAWVAVGLCGILIVANLSLDLQSHRTRTLQSNRRHQISGRTIEGQYVSLANDVPMACSIVRLASADCSYCRDDLSAFEAMERALKARGCRSVLVPPVPELIPRPLSKGRVNLAFPDLAFAESVSVAVVPTTIVLDGDGVLRWSKLGSLEARDVEDALEAMRGGRIE